MRNGYARRIAALEARPAPTPPSAADLAFFAVLESLYHSHASRVDPKLIDAIENATQNASAENLAVIWVDFIEAVGLIDPEAAAEIYAALEPEIADEKDRSLSRFNQMRAEASEAEGACNSITTGSAP